MSISFFILIIIIIIIIWGLISSAKRQRKEGCDFCKNKNCTSFSHPREED
jgi:FtsZ-interacting cell division protein ZipA